MNGDLHKHLQPKNQTLSDGFQNFGLNFLFQESISENNAFPPLFLVPDSLLVLFETYSWIITRNIRGVSCDFCEKDDDLSLRSHFKKDLTGQ
ncbi:hypothetical protein L2E82_38040 [Cichorium intybus]|uniref:Uncharacterized protein n=1 Tax=Cichorium intybus TaxID=13427 RepID=A0ACB9AGC2_CICIN|nr:hypothetical protein L2E82_38040 [Cichorium intybus]